MEKVPIRVLVVEDEGLIRLIVSEALRDAGFDVLEAVTGDEAAQLLEEPDGVDAVFTDVRMPGQMDGFALAAHVRRVKPDVPVLVTSGYATRLTERLQDLKLASEFVPKPYAIGDVVRRLERLTGLAA